jgi:hypothetical protein
MALAGVVAALALAGGGFVAGLTVARGSPESSTATGSPGARGPAFRQGAGQLPGGAQGRATSGQVVSVGEGTITLQLGQDQGSRIVLVAPSTRIVQTAEVDVPLTSLKPGDRITVVGQENSDGTLNALAVVVGGANVLQQFLGSPRPSPSR